MNRRSGRDATAGGHCRKKPHHLAVNGDRGIAQSKAAADLRTTVTTGKGPGGIRYTCTMQMDENGRSVLEQWVSSYGLSAGSLRRQWTAAERKRRQRILDKSCDPQNNLENFLPYTSYT